jgi:hypothetical protein
VPFALGICFSSPRAQESGFIKMPVDGAEATSFEGVFLSKDVQDNWKPGLELNLHVGCE